MQRHMFYRNVRARDHLEVFLVSAVSSLLGLRFYLQQAGYPQVGNGTLHIAHLLWGGLLMLMAIFLMLSYLGARVQRLAALIGGAGFGIFIDELGKFITKDNNYFFRPAVGIIYAVFISIYLLANFLSRDRHLSEEEYELNALMQLEEAVLHDMDRYEKERIRWLLSRSDPESPITQALTALLAELTPVPHAERGLLSRLEALISRRYRQFWARRGTSRLTAAIFIAESFVILAAVLAAILTNIDTAGDVLRNHGFSLQGQKLILGQLVAAAISAMFAIAGAVALQRSRLRAFELLRRALLVNIFLTEFFAFTRLQFRAFPGFVVNLLLLIVLHWVLHEERRSRSEA